MTLIHCQEAIEANQFYQPERKLQRGDVKAMLESADHVVEGSMRLGGQEHLYMETMSCIAIPKGEHREMEILASSQGLSTIQKTVSTALGVPANRIVVKVKQVGKCECRFLILPYLIGGGFGGKEIRSVAPYTAVAVAANKLVFNQVIN